MRLARDPAARARLAALSAVAATSLAGGAVVGAGAGGGSDEPPPALGGERGARSSPASRAAALPLERQVGQLLVMSFDGAEVPQYISRRLRRGEGAGVILFSTNVPDQATLRAITGRLQRSARGGALVATDQEGGAIRSIAFAAPEPSQPELGTPDSVSEAAGAAARELRAGGVNVNLAPVADVSSGPASVVAGRAYPGTADEVATLVDAAVRAHAAERVAATVKHFPGLGAATANTDDVPVTIETPGGELEERELPAFAAAVRADAPLVMASHALYPALDPDAIASQSPAVLDDLLRGRLRFRGAVITDSMEAEAVLARSDVATAAERSVEAGADLILMTGSGSWNLVYPRLLERARRDPGFRTRVRESAGRVLALKRRLGLRTP